MRKKRMKMIDAFPEAYEGNGIFSAMILPPWTEVYNPLELDIQFISEYGERLCSPLVLHYANNEPLTTENINLLARIVLNRFKQSWEHKFNILKVEYNPTDNYNMLETENRTNNGTEGVTLNKSIDFETTRTKNQTSNTNGETSNNDDESVDSSGSVAGNNQDNVYGFNSVASVPASENSNTTASTDKTTRKLTNSGTSRIDSTTADETTGDDSTLEESTQNTTKNDTENRTLTRKGNIGVTTTQQMLQSEIELWSWDFISDIFKDAASILTLSIYPQEEECNYV